MGHIVAITGKGRSGKDTVAGMLVGSLGFTRIGLADPMKRFCAEVFGFTHEQLHGNERDLPDSRYPRAFETYQYPDAPPGAVWVPVSAGKAFALVDADDAARVLDLRWTLVEKETGKANRYAKATVNGVEVKLHRFIYAAPAEQVDHVNGDGLDNRRANLRPCTNKENHANAEKRAGASSPFKGVTLDMARGKWTAKIAPDGVTINLGRFDTEGQAAAAYDVAAREHFGTFARLNTQRFLTPRFALQTLGTQWGRNCYRDIWVNVGINTARTLLADHAMAYSATTGLYTKTPWNQDMVNRGVVFSDIRFHSELAAMRRAGAITVFIDRPAEARGALAGVPDHASEREMDEMDQSAFDVVLHNVGTILDLNDQVVERLLPLLK